MEYGLARRINDEVNGSTQFREDVDLYFRPDFWTVAEGQGDCEDYALAKRKRLLEAGVPLEELRLAIVDIKGSGAHAVLLVTTDRGEFVLDNRFADPTIRQFTGYEWLMMEECGEWYKVA